MDLVHDSKNICIVFFSNVWNTYIIRIMSRAFNRLIASHHKPVSEGLHRTIHFKTAYQILFKIGFPTVS